jgi:hypothetical protein
MQLLSLLFLASLRYRSKAPFPTVDHHYKYILYLKGMNFKIFTTRKNECRSDKRSPSASYSYTG